MSPYTKTPRTKRQFSQIFDWSLILSQLICLFDKSISLLDARLGRGLVFDDKIALSNGITSDVCSEVEETASDFGEAGSWAKRGGGKEPSRSRGLSRHGGRKGTSTKEIWIGFRTVRGWREQRGWRAAGPWRRKEDGGASLFLHQIIDFGPAHFTHFCTCTYTNCIFATTTHPFHYTVAIDSGSEPRYVRRQGRGLAI